MRKELAICFLIALLARGLSALILPAPYTWDSQYYYLVAENLAKGRGLVEDFICHFQDNPQGIPHAAGSIWLPGTSLVEAAGMKLWGQSFRGAQLACVVLAALTVALSYKFTKELARDKYTAPLAAVLSLFCGYIVMNSADTDCFTFYALAGGMALYSMYRGRESPAWLAGAGLWIGLAHWTRQDAPLLWAVLGLYWLYLWRRGERLSTKAAAIAVGTYLVVIAPMVVRNLRIWGKLSPVNPLYPIFLTRYGKFFALDPKVDVASYLAKGPKWILSSKLKALWFNLALVGGYASFQVWEVPFLGLGIRKICRKRELFPILAYPPLLWLALSLIYTLPSMRGSFLHSISAFLPFGYGLAALGVGETGRLLGKCKEIDPARMARFLQILVALVTIGSTLVVLRCEYKAAQRREETYHLLSDFFSPTPEDMIIMAPNPPLVVYYARRRAVVTPDEDLETVVETMERYRAQYLVLEKGHVVEGLKGLWEGKEDPPQLELVRNWEERGVKIYKLDDQQENDQ